MRSTVYKACAVLYVASFVEELGREVRAGGDEILGSEKGSFVRISFHRFCSLRGYLVPMTVLPIRENFWSRMGRRVRLLDLSDSQRWVALYRGTDFRAALKVHRSTDPHSAVQVRTRDSAVKSSTEKRSRLS